MGEILLLPIISGSILVRDKGHEGSSHSLKYNLGKNDGLLISAGH